MPEFMNLHERAMELAQKGLLFQSQGRQNEALLVFREAFDAEKKVALKSKIAEEPLRSILFRSAVTLGVDCKAWREAENLIYIALSGQPPESIRQELKGLLQKVTYLEHLELRGIILAHRQFQVSFAGPAICQGIAETDVVFSRLNSLKRLIGRTAARKLNQDFDDAGTLPRPFRSDFEMFVGVPRSQSFALTVQIGAPIQQMHFDQIDQDEVIDETSECLDDFSNANLDKLKLRIVDQAYFRNFIALAKQISPDGEKVTTVGITTVRGGKERITAMTRPAKDILQSSEEFKPKPRKKRETKSQEIIGNLLYADSTTETDLIKIRDQGGNDHKIQVPSGMMVDIVKPLWNDIVVIRGKKVRDRIILETIDPVTSDSSKK